MLGFAPLGALPLGTASTGGGSYAYKDTIESGVVYPTYGRTATWSQTSGWSADFPVANLAKLDELRRVAVHEAPGEANISFLLPAAALVDVVAFINHNAPEGASYRLRLSTGTDPTADVVYDTGLLPFWPYGKDDDPLFPAVHPHKVPTGLVIRSGHIDLSYNDDPWEISAIEIGQFWSWPDIQFGRSIAVDAAAFVMQGSNAADHVCGLWAPRLVTGNREMVAQSELDTKLLDFQRTVGRHRTFFWTWNINDPASWLREAFMAKNRSLPTPSIVDYEVGSMSYDFEEHLA